MSEIQASQVKELREKTGAGMMDCKRALAEARGDLTRAVDSLRKQGLIRAAKKAGRAATEGLIGVAAREGPAKAALVEVNCETDFVARTEEFQSFVNEVTALALERETADEKALLAQSSRGGSVQDRLAQMIGRLGENMAIRRVALVRAGDGECVGSYLHAGAKIGTLVRIKGEGRAPEATREIAMHIAAMHPQYIRPDEIPEAVLRREREVIRATPDVASKPDHLKDRIIDGKLRRYYSDVCLLEQPFMRDPTGKKSVKVFLQETAPGSEVLQMIRFQVGEG